MSPTINPKMTSAARNPRVQLYRPLVSNLHVYDAAGIYALVAPEIVSYARTLYTTAWPGVDTNVSFLMSL